MPGLAERSFHVDRRNVDPETPEAIYRLDPTQGPETPEPVTTPRSDWQGDAPELIPRAVAHGLITKYMVTFLKVVLAGDLRYAPLLVPAYANSREPSLGFVASEHPWLGIPPEERACRFGFFPHARSREREQTDKEYWVSCP